MNGYGAYEKLIKKITNFNFILILILSLVLSLFLPFYWTVSLLMGLVLGVLNFHLLSKSLGNIFQSGFPILSEQFTASENSTHIKDKENSQSKLSEGRLNYLPNLQKGFTFKYYLRFTFNAVILYFIIRISWLNPWALLFGITLSLVNIVLTALYYNRSEKQERIEVII